MSTATITSKGQVTIPLEIRNNLGLNKGDKLDFTLSEGKIVIETRAFHTSDLYGILQEKRKKKQAVTVEEMHKGIAGFIEKKHK